jgi:glycosyltransferase involved in cell wall biosynthesis
MLIDNSIRSVEIPTRNISLFLKETLNELIDKLNYNIEIIIIDGNSNDNTFDIINELNSKYKNIKYFKLTDNKGFDFDLNYGITKATSEFCWMFSDDDIVHGSDLNTIIEKLIHYYDHDLILVNASVYNRDFTEIIQSKFVDLKSKSGINPEVIFDLFINYLSFFGGCIIKRNYWINANPEKYFGTLFVHIGVVFSNNSIKWHWIGEPYIKIRYGNASWSENSLEIWLTLWPKLLNNLTSINRSTINKHINTTPLIHLKKFILFKALGRYNINKAKNVYKTYNEIYLNIIQFIVMLIPQKVCHIISFIVAKISNKNTILYDLKYVTKHLKK